MNYFVRNIESHIYRCQW